MLEVKDLRDSFIDYFESKGHKIVHSSPLIPKDDPTLLFTTAGMVQFKPMFAGTVKLDYMRAASIQKCFRTSDLENVGKTKRHCTFFEMLGNFSFGDYFKKDAIAFAWDYSVNILKFSQEKIWISIYQDDDEAFEIWHKDIGVPAERIVRLGKEDNFWGPAGETGACGPCSELYYDKGPEAGCGSPDCKPGCDCERYMEYWNLVFNQYNQDKDGTLHPLPQTGIDTGMGLERLATICQNCDSIYETDELKQLVDFVCKELGVTYKDTHVTPINILVEHARALTFAMADGAYPSNEGRGYVLRRILRRALRFGRQLGMTKPFLYRMVDPIVTLMGTYYPELQTAAPNIKNVLEGEEKRFLETLEFGMQRLEEIMLSLQEQKNKCISGKDAFLLYDTYGFPIEMTREIAAEKELMVDMQGFEKEMQKQRERGKQSWKGADSLFEQLNAEMAKKAGNTQFEGYGKEIVEAQVVLLAGKDTFVNTLDEGDAGYMVTNCTTFYGESGGQVGDTGIIRGKGNALFQVSETIKANKTIIHVGKVSQDSFAMEDIVSTEIDAIKRNLIKANHTVTHLLQAALRTIVGTHVKQAGSYVASDYFRFDFSHFEAMTAEQLQEVENMVNQKIWENIPLTIEFMDKDKALQSGAMAEFGEKYEDRVRVVSIADYSKELCGGTHVDNTGKIGIFKIVKEGSPGAGMRRIEGITLKGVWEKYNTYQSIVTNLSQDLHATEKDLVKKIQDLVQKNNDLKKQIEKVNSKQLVASVDSIVKNSIEVGGISIIAHVFEGVQVQDLRSMADIIRSKRQQSVVLFGSAVNGKAMLLCAATQAGIDIDVDCGAVIKEISRIVGGAGGGRKDMAQAGGKNPAHLNQAIEQGVEKLKAMITS